MQLLDGIKLRSRLLEEYKKKISREKLSLRLDIILIGDDEASELYVRNKIKYCEYVGIEVAIHKLKNDVSERKVLDLIDSLNASPETTGIILQSPVPPKLDFTKLSRAISPLKDVDGFTQDNIFNLYNNCQTILPCTVKAILTLLKEYEIEVKGRNVVIVGRGNIVGKPLALALINRDATVTICHSKTPNLEFYTRAADILISATGQTHLIDAPMVKDGFIGIDVGISKDKNGRLTGDMDFDNLQDKASYLTPVPGGVGPMTVAMIIDNLIEISKLSIK